MVFDRKGMMEKFPIQEVECPERLKGVEGQNYVYLLICSDQSFYCGVTHDIKNRIQEHNAGEAATWTAKRTPVRLVYYELHDSLLSARKREKQIKGWTRSKKINLMRGIWGKVG